MSKRLSVASMIVAIASIVSGGLSIIGLAILIIDALQHSSSLESVIFQILSILAAGGIVTLGALLCSKIVRRKSSSLALVIVLLCFYSLAFMASVYLMFLSIIGLIAFLATGGCVAVCILSICWNSDGKGAVTLRKTSSSIDNKIAQIKHLRSLYVISDEQAKDAAHKLLDDEMNKE